MMEELGILYKATEGIATVNVNRFRSGRVCIEVVASCDESRDEFSFSGSSLSEVAKSAYAKALALGLTNDV